MFTTYRVTGLVIFVQIVGDIFDIIRCGLPECAVNQAAPPGLDGAGDWGHHFGCVKGEYAVQG